MDLGSLLTILQTVPAARTGIKGRDLSAQKKIAGQLNQVSQAQYDPKSAIYQNIYNENKSGNQQNLAQVISEIQRQNRKAQTMGHAPLLDQERGGESVFRNLILGQQDTENNARTNTLNQLRGAQSGLTSTYGAYDDISQAQYGNDVTKAGTIYGVGDTLKKLLGLPTGQGQSNNGSINWNTPRYTVY